MGSRIFQLLKSVNLPTSISRYLHASTIKQSDTKARLPYHDPKSHETAATIKQCDVKATLLHHDPEPNKPASTIKQSVIKAPLPYHDPKSNKTKWVECTIKDGRGQKFTLDKNGFSVMKHETSLSYDDFRNDERKIYTVYYKEMAEAIKEHTGAALVQIYQPPKVRIVDDIKRHESGGFFFIHSVSNTFYKPNIDNQYLKGRYLVLDCWRNITDTPVAKNAMAQCDTSSITYPDDYILVDPDPDYEFQNRPPTPTLRLHDGNKENHKWFYFSGMKKDEVLLFHQFDSDTPDSMMNFHSAFEDPNTPEDAPVRVSCDVRAMAFFPTKEPWNI